MSTAGTIVTGHSQYRAGYFVDSLAFRRFFRKGFGIRMRPFPAELPPPEMTGSEAEVREKKELYTAQLATRAEEELQLLDKFEQFYRAYRSRATPEVRAKLAILHFTERAYPCDENHLQGELAELPTRRQLFLPTSGRDSGVKLDGPTETDAARLHTFIELANGLIKRDDRRASAGFTEADFKFMFIPEAVLWTPVFTRSRAVHAAWHLPATTFVTVSRRYRRDAGS